MKRIHLLAFRGTGFSNPQYRSEPALVRAGHVGIRFEDDNVIYGFHPTAEAAINAGGENAIIELLKEHVHQPGSLQIDTLVFVRAVELARQGAPTEVYSLEYEFTDEEFERIFATVNELHETQKEFWYNFPDDEGEFNVGEYNCATFPEVFGLRLPIRTGYIRDYVLAMKDLGASLWQAKS
jgi:hypothetical protein